MQTAFAIRLLCRVVLPVMRVLHRATLTGVEHLPEPGAGAYLLVSNHPASLGVTEFPALAALFAERFRGARPLAGYAHHLFFHWWPLSWLFPHIGAIPSTYAAAEQTLAVGVPIILFPGGDHEAFRPLGQANRVDFAGRLGFLKIARKAWVPIVPMAFRGSATPFLFRARALAWFFVWPRLMRVKRFGLSVLAVIGAALILRLVPLAWPWRVLLAWMFAGSPLALLPMVPATIRIRIGPALAPETMFGARESPQDDAGLVRALGLVEQAVQALLDAPAAAVSGPSSQAER